MGVFGRGRGIVLRPRLPPVDVSRAPLDRTDRRRPFGAFERAGNDEPGAAGQRGQHNGLSLSVSADQRAFRRVRRFEYEGPRHGGKRQVERHVDEDRQNEQPPGPHAPSLTYTPPRMGKL